LLSMFDCKPVPTAPGRTIVIAIEVIFMAVAALVTVKYMTAVWPLLAFMYPPPVPIPVFVSETQVTELNAACDARDIANNIKMNCQKQKFRLLFT